MISRPNFIATIVPVGDHASGSYFSKGRQLTYYKQLVCGDQSEVPCFFYQTLSDTLANLLSICVPCLMDVIGVIICLIKMMEIASLV